MDSRSKPSSLNNDMQVHLEMKSTRVRNTPGCNSKKESMEKYGVRSKDLREPRKESEELESLRRENEGLKKQIVEFKVTQFYQFDD